MSACLIPHCHDRRVKTVLTCAWEPMACALLGALESLSDKATDDINASREDQILLKSCRSGCGKIKVNYAVRGVIKQYFLKVDNLKVQYQV